MRQWMFRAQLTFLDTCSLDCLCFFLLVTYITSASDTMSRIKKFDWTKELGKKARLIFFLYILAAKKSFVPSLQEPFNL